MCSPPPRPPRRPPPTPPRPTGSAQAGLTQTLAQSAAADAQTQGAGPGPAELPRRDGDIVDRNQAVATAQGSSGSFSSQLAAAGQQYVTQATAAGDAYNTAAAAGDLAYATATSQIDDAYATATDSTRTPPRDAQTADSGTLQTALADDQAGYDENQQTTYAGALSGLGTSDPSPWAQLSAAQASAEETATDTINTPRRPARSRRSPPPTRRRMPRPARTPRRTSPA